MEEINQDLSKIDTDIEKVDQMFKRLERTESGEDLDQIEEFMMKICNDLIKAAEKLINGSHKTSLN